MVGLSDPTTHLVVPHDVRMAAVAALAERDRRQGGGTLSTVSVAAQLCVGSIPLGLVEHISEWHRRHPEAVQGERSTLAGGLMGGAAGRAWAAGLSAATKEALAEEQRWATFSARVNDISQRLGTSLWNTAEQAVQEALRRARVKLRVRVMSKGGKDPERQARTAALAERIDSIDWSEARGIVAAVGVTEEELLDRAMESFEVQASRILTDAETERLTAVALLLDDDSAVSGEYETARRNAEAAARWLSSALLAILLAKVRGQRTRFDDDGRGEGAELAVAFGLIARAMALASGSGRVMSADTDDGVIDVLVDDVPLIEQLMREAGVKFEVAFLWRHGFFGRPLRFFQPHYRLDQHVLTSMRDPLLEVDPADAWLRRTHYAPGDHVNCFPLGTPVAGPPPIGVSLRHYEGEMVVISLASGNLISATPNHPILTLDGWVPIGELSEGDDVVTCFAADGGPDLVPHDQQVQARIEDVAAALVVGQAMVPVSVPVAAVDFHGDAAEGQVAVVWANRLLRGDLDPATLKVAEQEDLAPAHPGVGLPPERSAPQLFARGLPSTGGGIGSGDDFAPTFRRAPGADGEQGLGERPWPDLVFVEPSAHDASADAEVFGEGIDRAEMGRMKTDKVVSVDRDENFSGHVMNLQTKTGWYTVNGVVVHNCSCWAQVIYTGGQP